MSFDPDFFRRATGGSTTTDQLVAGLAFATVATAGLIGWDYFKRVRDGGKECRRRTKSPWRDWGEPL